MAATHYFLNYKWLLRDSNASKQLSQLARTSGTTGSSDSGSDAPSSGEANFESAVNECIMSVPLVVNVRLCVVYRQADSYQRTLDHSQRCYSAVEGMCPMASKPGYERSSRTVSLANIGYSLVYAEEYCF